MNTSFTKTNTPYIIFGWRLTQKWMVNVYGKVIVGSPGEYVLRDPYNFWWVESAVGVSVCYQQEFTFQPSGLYIYIVKGVMYNFITPRNIYVGNRIIYCGIGDTLVLYNSGAAFYFHKRMIKPLVIYPDREPHVRFTPHI